MSEPAFSDRLDALLDWFGRLSPQTLPLIDHFYAEQVQFQDPFNRVNGRSDLRRLFQHMFDSSESARFVIADRLLDGRQAFVTWDFHCRIRGRDYHIHGGSHLRFDAAGTVVWHRDYWDAAEELLQKLPLIGVPVRWLRRLFRVPGLSEGPPQESRF
ncbi:hypothetical protein THUN1379_02450 [Paludibacterium sp. THUN1379]|uniref:nuclear transport factor 2 family protein n=1 Tax=Paludibacterium sp. THUN1379 TaxID=3112107 RepID=UPI0030873481|nr:hypothetical protein THUN1379_02450 [Paludibacterium sp. THUN1379]